MRMTRLEWRYLQKIALDHPYFDTHKLPLTEKEAKAIVEASNTMTGREFVDSIYAKLSMTRPEEKKDRFAWLHQVGEQFAVPPIRRIAITVLVVVLLTIFFAATPTGRAIADSVVRYIATLFEDGRLVVNRSDNEQSSYCIPYDDFMGDVQDSDSDFDDIIYIASFEEFNKATGKTPIELQYPYIKLYYIYDEETNYLDMNAIYEAPNGKIVTYQLWNVDEIESIALEGFNLYDEERSIYYSIEKDKGIIHCKLIMEDSVFSMTSEGNFTLDELIHLLQNH